MAIDILKEVNRAAGYNVASGQDIISGQPVRLVDSETIRPYDNASLEVLGLALDDTKSFDLAAVPTTKAVSGTARPIYDKPSGDLTEQSLFFSEVNRGGLVSVALDGGEFGLLDDGRGSPYNTGDTFNLNEPVYADDATGLVTSDSGTSTHKQIGMTTKAPGSDGKLVVMLRL